MLAMGVSLMTFVALGRGVAVAPAGLSAFDVAVPAVGDGVAVTVGVRVNVIVGVGRVVDVGASTGAVADAVGAVGCTVPPTGLAAGSTAPPDASRLGAGNVVRPETTRLTHWKTGASGYRSRPATTTSMRMMTITATAIGSHRRRDWRLFSRLVEP